MAVVRRVDLGDSCGGDGRVNHDSGGIDGRRGNGSARAHVSGGITTGGCDKSRYVINW